MTSNPTLEILISTMNRRDLSFLKSMFPYHQPEEFSILIINQTQHEEDLISHYDTIRVINSRVFGLSKSRNLAIENAIGDILLLADDDIQYLPNFEKIILQAYDRYDQASLISFQYLNENKELVKFYPKSEGYISSSKQYLSSVEMTVNKSSLNAHHINFDERFGLGAKFICAEEQVFRHEILSKNLKVAFVSKPICIHLASTSGSKLDSPENIKAMTAFKYFQYGNLVYLWLLKYVFFLYRHGFISFFEQKKSYHSGMQSIIEIKEMQNEN